MRRWYTVVSGNPGFTTKVFETIKQRAHENPVYCNLVVDEMYEKRLLEGDTQQKMYGHIDLGTNSTYDGDDIPLAKNALVFLIVSMNGYWKLPIGYFLIDGLNEQERGKLLKIAIDLINDTGAHLH